MSIKLSPKNRILRAAVKRFEDAVAAVAAPRVQETEEDAMFIAEEYRLAKANLNSLIGLTKRTK